MNISVTHLSSYLYCPRKYFIEHILKIKTPPVQAMVLGTIRHEAYDLINKKEEQIVKNIKSKLSFAGLVQHYKQHHLMFLKQAIGKHKQKLKSFSLQPTNVFKQTWPLVSNETKDRALLTHRFLEEHNVFGEELWQVVFPKPLSELYLKSPNLQLKGIVDKVEQFEDVIVPVEYKTGSLPKEGVWPGHRIQLAAYCMMLTEKCNQEVFKGYVKYLDANIARPVVVNPFIEAEVKDLTQQVVLLKTEKQLPDFCANKNKCKKCPHKKLCYDKERMATLTKNI